MSGRRSFLRFTAAAIGAWAVLTVCPPRPAPAADDGRRLVRVVRIVDGDTVVVAEGSRTLRVRLLGVDTPELARDGRRAERFAEEAARFTREALRGAWRVELEVAGDRIDDYGRILGFLWLQPRPPARTFNLSEELLRQGLGRAFHRYRYPGRARFLGLEAEARRSRRGLWRR
ncbi:MAG: thermonuclease family protein [Deltaproteobacteria bacterium]|nr:thermonuclease family protein [Deltaproteobacteria bacterium]